VERDHAGQRNAAVARSTVDGVKTGFTEARVLLVAPRSARARLVSVVMGAQTDALRMSENQSCSISASSPGTRSACTQGEVVANPEIFKGTSATVKLGFDRDVWLTLRATASRPEGAAHDGAALRRSYSRAESGIMKLARVTPPSPKWPCGLEDVPMAVPLARMDTIRLLFR